AKRLPYLFVGWFWYLGMLVPVIGLVQVGDQAWADRYTYLPLIGLFIAVVWGVGELWERWLSQGRGGIRLVGVVGRIVVCAVCFTLCVVVTSRQLRYWQNTRTLFTHAAQVTHKNAKAITILGSLLANEGKMDQAMALYAEALSYQPDDPETHFSRANA